MCAAVLVCRRAGVPSEPHGHLDVHACIGQRGVEARRERELFTETDYSLPPPLGDTEGPLQIAPQRPCMTHLAFGGPGSRTAPGRKNHTFLRLVMVLPPHG